MYILHQAYPALLHSNIHRQPGWVTRLAPNNHSINYMLTSSCRCRSRRYTALNLIITAAANDLGPGGARSPGGAESSADIVLTTNSDMNFAKFLWLSNIL